MAHINFWPGADYLNLSPWPDICFSVWNQRMEILLNCINTACKEINIEYMDLINFISEGSKLQNTDERKAFDDQKISLSKNSIYHSGTDNNNDSGKRDLWCENR
jgi:hypothetical protein